VTRTTTTGDELCECVGQHVIQWRRQRGVTQEKLAEKLGMSLARVKLIESGGANLSLQSLARLANALGVHATWLLGPPTAPVVRKRGRPRKRP